jgi:hypothetical protein
VTKVKYSNGGSINLDLSLGEFFEVTVGQNTTLASLAVGQLGALLYILVAQDATGGYSVTFPANVGYAGGSAPSAPAGSGEKLLLVLVFDGTGWREVSRVDYS